jgi:hypothetical protein
MEACYGGTDVMERSCAVARGIDINRNYRYLLVALSTAKRMIQNPPTGLFCYSIIARHSTVLILLILVPVSLSEVQSLLPAVSVVTLLSEIY